MLWFGYIYYIIFNFMLVSFSLFILRLYSLNSISKTNLISFLNKTFLSFILYLFMVMFMVLNSLLNYYHDLLFVSVDVCIGHNLTNHFGPEDA